MRTLYQLLVVTFILTNLSGILFFVFYLQGIFDLLGGWNSMAAGTAPPEPSPDDVFHFFFNPKVVISLLVLIISSLANMILGIVLIARNRNLPSEAKVLWILGFILLGFVTNIVFFALKKSHNLLGTAPAEKDDFGLIR